MGAGFLLLLAVLSPWLALLVVLQLGAIVLLIRLVGRLRTEAQQDFLTGLINRRGLALQWKRLADPKAVLLIDLDGFKQVNDRYGHSFGDILLRQVARRLAAAVPPPGHLARWGGDEFVAIVPAARMPTQIDLLRNAMVIGFDLPGNGRVHIGISIGTDAGTSDLETAVAGAVSALMAERAARSRATSH